MSCHSLPPLLCWWLFYEEGEQEEFKTFLAFFLGRHSIFTLPTIKYSIEHLREGHSWRRETESTSSVGIEESGASSSVVKSYWDSKYLRDSILVEEGVERPEKKEKAHSIHSWWEVILRLSNFFSSSRHDSLVK